MACGISFEAIATSTVLFLLVLLQTALVWDQVQGAPAKRSDILAGTEFLSVFINGAMATPPQRRRGFRRGGQTTAASDSATAESHQHEASIYRISRNPNNRQTVSRARNMGGPGDEVVRFYPISQKTLDNRQQNLASFIDELSTTGEITSTHLTPQSSTTTVTSVTPRERSSSRSNGSSSSGNATSKAVSRQKVIGVSVTSTVEATPYKVRVEHYDSADATVVTRPPISGSSSSRESSNESTTGRRVPSPPGTATSTTTTTTTSATTRTRTTTTTSRTSTSTSTVTTPLPSSFVTEELSNIVSESNRSEFSVDEGSPSTSWRGQSSVTTPRPSTRRTSVFPEARNDGGSSRNHADDMITLPTEENYELPEENSEPREMSEELAELQAERFHSQGRKAGRHYDASHYNRPGTKVVYNGQQPSSKGYKPTRTLSEPPKVYSEPAKVYGEPERVYGEPAKVYSEPSKVYGEPAKVYSEPAKVYSEPAKVYGEPEKIYSEPSKVYSEPAKIYSEPAKIYSQPAKVYGEPSKVYDSEGQPVNRDHRQRAGGSGGGGEPDEQNYEVDESVSVGSNGNVHGPQLILTEPPNASEAEDGHKVGYIVEGRNYRKYRVEERTPDGFIVGEYGVVSHDDGSLRGVRYTADGTINPRLIYDALMKFLAL